jgi:hypothetical protein
MYQCIRCALIDQGGRGGETRSYIVLQKFLDIPSTFENCTQVAQGNAIFLLLANISLQFNGYMNMRIGRALL